MTDINRLELKSKAKDFLRDNYWQCLAVCLATNFVTQGFSMSIQLPVQLTSNNLSSVETHFNASYMPYFGLAYIGIMFGIIILALAFSIFLTAPLTVGLKRFFIKSITGEPKIPVILDVFKSTNYLNVVKVTFMKNLFLTLWTMTGLIPYIIIVTVITIMYPSAIMRYAAAFIPFLAIIAMIPYLVKYYSYFTVEYILAENLHISWRDAMNKGKEMMKGNTTSTFILQLSFIGWLLLGALACGLGVIFVAPYIEATNTQLYLTLKNKYSFEI